MFNEFTSREIAMNELQTERAAMLAAEMMLTPNQAVYLPSAIRKVSEIGKISTDDAIDQIIGIKELGDYIRAACIKCDRSHPEMRKFPA